MMRCAGAQLECFKLEVCTDGVVKVRSQLLDLGGTEPGMALFAVHCLTQRVGAQPVPVVGTLCCQYPEGADEADKADESGRAKFSIRIFGSRTLEREASLEDIFDDYQSISLNYVPCLLKNIFLPDAESQGLLAGAFLVAGSNKELRILAQRADSMAFEFVEHLQEAFVPPSFAALRTQVLCCDMRHVAGVGLVAAFGCESGSVLLTVGGVEKSRAQLDGPVSSVQVFSSVACAVGRSSRQEMWRDVALVSWSLAEPASAIDWDGLVGAAPENSRALAALARLLRPGRKGIVNNGEESICQSEAHLAVGGAAGFALVFEDVVHKGLENPRLLVEDCDAVLCMAAGDFNFDGTDELLIGTFGGKILVFRQHETTGKWSMLEELNIGVPVHCFAVIRTIDVVPYLLVGTQLSLDVMAPPLRVMEEVLIQRLDQAASEMSPDFLSLRNAK